MFIFDFVAETVLDQIIDWLYGKIVGFLNDFFAMMNNMGVELFDLPWVNAITTFFSWLGWALFVVGLVVGAFECAIEYQGGRGSIKDTALNYVKGFMAVSLFSILPVNLYSLSVSLQSSFGSALSGITDAESIGMTAQQVLMSAAMPGVGNPILQIFCAVMMGYAVIKVFFGNLKRGGILLIQIAVGSLYMFSVPRGYIDPVVQAGHWNLSHRFPAVHHAHGRTHDLQGPSSAWSGCHAFLHGGAEDCRTVRTGHQHKGKPDERSLCSADSHQHFKNGCQSSGSIRR